MSNETTMHVALPLLLTGAAFLLPAGSTGTDGDEFTWPQWDGPQRNGLSKETAWSSAGKEEHLWQTEVGLGYSTVSVAGGRLYTMGYDVEAGLDMIFCLDALTGEEIWSHTYESEIWNQAHEGGTVNTPSIDGEVVYTLNREGNAYCLDAKTGEVLWHNDLMAEGNTNELESPTWDFSASPLVLEDELLLNCGRILSLDKKTGKIKWSSKDYGHAYGTAAAFDLEGEPAIAVLNGAGVGVASRKDGKELFFRAFGGSNRGVNAATPIVIEDAVFVSSDTKPGGALLAFGDGELVPVWESREMVNAFSGCVRIGEHLYGFDQSVLKCIDLTGKPMWDARGIGNGAVLGTPDRLVLMGGTGELIVAEASPKEFKELSRVKLFDAGQFWSKPILVNGIIYCRSSKGMLVARDHRATARD